MRTVLGAEHLGDFPGPSVVTIGKFFAVHRGHRALLRQTAAAARRHGAAAVVLTFDRHPLEVLRPGAPLPLLASLEERLEWIAAEGLDLAVVLRVTPEFLATEPEEFARSLLCERLVAREVLASSGFRFGRGARGDLALLRRLGAELGFSVTEVLPVLEDGERISSSRIAACLTEGRVAEAARLLGRPHALPGRVGEGDRVGRSLGFPTANVITPPERLHPRDGVYLVRVLWDGQSHPAVANLGVRPTRDGTRRLLEAHLLDWSGNLYGQEVRVEFLERLRDELRFPDLDQLRAQIARDVSQARRLAGLDETGEPSRPVPSSAP